MLAAVLLTPYRKCTRYKLMSRKYNCVAFLMGLSRPPFIFSSFLFYAIDSYIFGCVDIWTVELWRQKRPLCQLCHIHCPHCVAYCFSSASPIPDHFQDRRWWVKRNRWRDHVRNQRTGQGPAWHHRILVEICSTDLLSKETNLKSCQWIIKEVKNVKI